MAVVQQAAVVLMQGVDLSAFLKSIKISGIANLLDATSLRDGLSKSFVKGLKEFAVTGESYWNSNSANAALDADGLFRAALNDAESDYLLSIGELGAQTGALAQMLRFKKSKYEISQKPGDIVMATFEGKADKAAGFSPYQTGVWLFNGQASGATNSSVYDSAADGTGWLANIHNYGSGSATVQIQHSATAAGTYADLTSQIMAANSAMQISSLTDTRYRYLRAVITPASGAVSIGIAFKPDYAG